jgi:cytochrome b
VPETRRPAFKVWDLLIRLLHWSLASSFFAAYFTRHVPGPWHEWLGYLALAIIVARVFLGFSGSHYARFSQFIRPFGYTLTYCRDVISGHHRRYLGHNPLGAWMVVALLLLSLATCLSGWLYTTDRFWGVEWVEDLHDALTWATLGLIVVHVAGIFITSFHDRENLVAAMLHGRKRVPSREDVH